MMASISDFVGQYTLAWAEGARGLLRPKQQLFIGTGCHGDSEPQLTKDYQLVVGVTFWNPETQERVLYPGAEEPFLFLYDQGQLVHLQLIDKRLPSRMQISLYQDRALSRAPKFKVAYGVSLIGDPEEVGVWGADGNLPGGSPDDK